MKLSHHTYLRIKISDFVAGFSKNSPIEIIHNLDKYSHRKCHRCEIISLQSVFCGQFYRLAFYNINVIEHELRDRGHQPSKSNESANTAYDSVEFAFTRFCFSNFTINLPCL